MKTTSEILRYLIHPVSGKPLLTVLFRNIPKLVVAQITRHRSLSPAVQSSRAASTQEMLDLVRRDPYLPSPFLCDQKGMGGLVPLPEYTQAALEAGRKHLLTHVLHFAEQEHKAGVKKEQVNRLLEPFSCCDMILSGTDWSDILRLRCAPDVDNALRVPIREMAEQLYTITPTENPAVGEWSIPLLLSQEQEYPLTQKLITSAARCARTTYGKQGKPSSLKADCRTFLRLVGEDDSPEELYDAPRWDIANRKWVRATYSTKGNLHSSPLEMQVLIVDPEEACTGNYGPGFQQFRHMLDLIWECTEVAKELLK
jgi:hypothetical protein